MRLSWIAALVALVANASWAAQPFGTKEEARRLAEQLIQVIEAEGIRAAAEAVYNPEMPFLHTAMGVNLFTGSTVIADNREPEMVAADFSQTEDLTGAPAWPRIAAAADIADDAVLKWYHYDTQEVYDFHCFSMRATRDDGLVMVCR